jgi:hypothetical protein
MNPKFRPGSFQAHYRGPTQWEHDPREANGEVHMREPTEEERARFLARVMPAYQPAPLPEDPQEYLRRLRAEVAWYQEQEAREPGMYKPWLDKFTAAVKALEMEIARGHVREEEGS